MADDAIFDTTPAQGQQGNEPTMTDLTQQLARGIQQALAPTEQRLAAIEQRMSQQPAQQQQPTPDDGSNPIFSRLVADPAGAIRDGALAAVSPVLQPMLDAVQEPIVDKARASIVARYGEKAWREVVEPRFETQRAALRQQNPAALANPAAIKYMLSSIVGSEDLADTLETHRQQTAREAADAAKRRERPPAVVGGTGRMAYTGDESEPLSEEDRLMIDKINNRWGYKFDEAAFRAAAKKPKDMEQRYQQEQAAKRAAQGGK